MRPSIRSLNPSKQKLTPMSIPPLSHSTPLRHHPPSGPYTATTYIRRADHTPNTPHVEKETYILTLHTTAYHQTTITALRTHYFPPHLNKLPAHIALFRALPGSHLAPIQDDILTLCSTHPPFPLSTGAPFLLSHGVGFHVQAAPAGEIYKSLKEKWVGFLSAQDKSFRAHYTIQNKVGAGVARETLEEVERGFAGSSGEVDGLVLWRYERGFWRLVEEFAFGGKREEWEG